jgi:TP901 family phage tail tape measure protein
VPLGVREVLLIVRAQNLGSGVLRNLAGDFNNLDAAAKKSAQSQMQTGTALMAVGAGIAAAGAAGLLFLGKATAAAVDYNRQVALTKTQTYGLKVTLDQLSQAGLDVAKSIAVPLDQVQAGLYDIFSSMDVNLSQAKFLLANFSKEAVAGQVDLSTAERATIGIMNSYQMKVQDVSKVQDIMFNLVKYGVGTYGDFASVIGRVTPNAVRANQTFEETAGMLAFVTRNGLSAANGAASVGRALDAIGKSRDKIQNLGLTVQGALGSATASKLGFTASTMIKVTDAAGKLLPVNQIMTNLGEALKGLNPTQLNDVLNEMFKGTGGTIQAQRFFSIAIHNYSQLNALTKDMYTSKGALQAAYNTMAATPAMKIQLLKNNFQAFMIVLGQQLLPIVGKVASFFTGLLKILSGLSPSTIRVIAIVIGVTSVLAVLAGIIMVVVGAWMVFSVVLAASEVALAPILITIGLVIAAVVALSVAAYFIYKNWSPISTWFHNMWFDMWKWIDHIWQLIYKSISNAWLKVKNVFLDIQKFIVGSFDKWWKTHGDALVSIWNTTWGQITGSVTQAWTVIEGVVKIAMAIIEAEIKIGLDLMMVVFKVAWDVIVAIFRGAWDLISTAFKIWFTVLVASAKIGLAVIEMTFKIFWDLLVGIFSIFIDLLTGHWHQAFVDMQQTAVQIWNAIKGFLSSVWNAINSAAIPIWHDLENMIVGAWHNVYNLTQQVWNAIGNYLKQVWNGMVNGAKTTVSGLNTVWQGIEAIFKTPVNFVIGTVYDNGLRRLWNDVMGAIGLGKLNMPDIPTLAAGGRIPGWGGGDRIPILAEAGEAIVDKNRTRKYAGLLGMMGVPGFALGGIVSNPLHAIASVASKGANFVKGAVGASGAVGKMLAAAATGNQTAFANALLSVTGGAGGAAANLAQMMVGLPVSMAKDAVSSLWSKITGSGGVAGSVKFNPSGGVMQWQGLVMKALAMEGLGSYLASQVLYQMMTESGGNPNAINNWDINAQQGDPSRGLLQVIGSTFSAFHWPGTSNNIYDPLANIAAAINYARSTYGPTLMRGGMGMGSGHGYAAGTSSASPGWSWVGEQGPELMRMRGGEQVAPVRPVQNFYITTQEINPKYHAAQLGWELARRSS